MKTRHSLVATSLAGVVVVAMGVGIAAAAQTSTPTQYKYFEKQESWVHTPRPGTSPQGQPGPGDTVEFTSLDFKGDHAKHAAHWTATDHFICVFDRQGIPTCDGQVAIDDSMLLIHGTGGQGTFTIPVTGGTGKFRTAHGTLRVHDLPDGNSDIVINLEGLTASETKVVDLVTAG